jgi:transposase
MKGFLLQVDYVDLELLGGKSILILRIDLVPESGLLMSILGIGFLTALTIYSEVCGVTCFSSPEKLAHYAGLVPRVKNSGEHTMLVGR